MVSVRPKTCQDSYRSGPLTSTRWHRFYMKDTGWKRRKRGPAQRKHGAGKLRKGRFGTPEAYPLEERLSVRTLTATVIWALIAFLPVSSTHWVVRRAARYDRATLYLLRCVGSGANTDAVRALRAFVRRLTHTLAMEREGLFWTHPVSIGPSDGAPIVRIGDDLEASAEISTAARGGQPKVKDRVVRPPPCQSTYATRRCQRGEGGGGRLALVSNNGRIVRRARRRCAGGRRGQDRPVSRTATKATGPPGFC